MALKYINKVLFIVASVAQYQLKIFPQKTSDAHALALLAACYLPGVFAAYLQLAR